jgi:hypothetical protein
MDGLRTPLVVRPKANGLASNDSTSFNHHQLKSTSTSGVESSSSDSNGTRSNVVYDAEFIIRLSGT